MKLTTKAAVLLGASAMLLSPAAALAGRPADAPIHPMHPTHPANSTPGPKAPLPELAHAYGVYCRGASKEHKKGEKGTEFSRCVTAAAKVANGESPKAACQSSAKKHEAGEKGTEFSRCVAAANQLRKAGTNS